MALPTQATERTLNASAPSPPHGSFLGSWFVAHSRTSSLAFCFALYGLLTTITAANFMGDTVDYAHSAAVRIQGQYFEFWDFGHALWRPLGWVILRILGIVSPGFLAADVLKYHSILVLIVVSWLGGFAILYFFHRVAWSLTGNFLMASLGTVGFATAQAFLDYVQAGASYIFGLTMLMLAIYLLRAVQDPNHGQARTTWGGVALAGAVLFWFPYVLVVPAVVLMVLLRRRTLRDGVLVSISFSVTAAVGYLAIILAMGLHRPSEVLAWMRASSHGIEISGVTRAVFGFARSFVNMGREGMIFKRYLVHDPFAPVSLSDLLRLVLVKLALFYAAGVSVLAVLIIRRRWDILAVLVAAMIPVLGFAVHWQGGDTERYLPLYPFLFLALVVVMVERPPKFQRPIIIAFVAMMALVNVFALSRSRLHSQQEQTARRFGDIPATALDLVYVSHNGDDVFNFSRSFPFAEVNRRGPRRVLSVIEIGRRDSPLWRAGFSRMALRTWDQQGNVWVSQRLFSPVPKPEWNWVEHDDPRISWKDLSPFFSRLQYADCVGGNDGFCRIAPSESNREILMAFPSS